AIEAHARGRTGLSRVAIALAPFAKETGFLALPMVLAWARFCEGERRYRPWMGRHALTVLVTLAVHGAVRLAWTGGGTRPHGTPAPEQLPAFALEVLEAFVARRPAPGLAPPALAIAAALAAVLLMRSLLRPSATWADAAAGRGSGEAMPGPAQAPMRDRSTAAFALGAAVLGLTPAVAGHLLMLT